MSRSAGHAIASSSSPTMRAELRAQLQAVTGERIAALEGIGEAPGKGAEFAQAGAGKERDGGGMEPKDREMPVQERERAVGMDLGL